MFRYSTFLFLIGMALVPGLFGQKEEKLKALSPNAGERLVAVVPMIGTGSAADPIRPFGVPSPAQMRQVRTPGEAPELPVILSYRYQLAPDKKTAILEIVGRDAEALAELRNAKRSDVKVFELGKNSKDEIEAEFKKYKPDFKADDFEEKADAPKVGGAK